MVSTLTLNKGVTMVDEDAIIEPTDVVGALTLVAEVTSRIGTVRGGEGAEVAATTVAGARSSTADRARGKSCKLEG